MTVKRMDKADHKAAAFGINGFEEIVRMLVMLANHDPDATARITSWVDSVLFGLDYLRAEMMEYAQNHCGVEVDYYTDDVFEFPGPPGDGWPPVQLTAPDRIYLQVSEEERDQAEEFPKDHAGITWFLEPTAACEVAYIRADLRCLERRLMQGQLEAALEKMRWRYTVDYQE